MVEPSNTDDQIHVLVVDSQPIVRAGLKMALEATDACKVVAEAGDGYAAIMAARQTKPNIVLLDANLTKMDAHDATASMIALPEPPRIIVCFVSEDAFEVRQLVQAGVTGFISKSAEPEEFLNAVRAVHGGGNYISGSLMSSIFAGRETSMAGVNVYGLTQREVEVLSLLADGFSNKEVARRLDLSVRTVETHRLNIRKKTKAGTLSDLVRIARKLGLKSERSSVPNEMVGMPGLEVQP